MSLLQKLNPTKNKYLDGGFVLVSIMVGFYLEWNIVGIALLVIFVWVVLNPLPSRYFSFAALFTMVLTPFLVAMDRKEQAEQLAVYAYYFLIMAIWMGLYEIRDDANKKDN